jgi:dihydroorotate dehydrogenase
MDAIGRSAIAAMVAVSVGVSTAAHLLVGASLIAVTVPLIAGGIFYLMHIVHAIRSIAARRR